MSLQQHRWSAVRWPLAISVAILVALAVRVALVWSLLPPVVASHFGAGGAPNDHMGRFAFFVLMGAMTAGIVALLFGIPMFLRRLPSHMLNVPNRNHWLATEARRIEALDKLAAFLGWMAVATTALMAIALELALRANLNHAPLNNGVMWAALVAYFVFVIAGLAWRMRTFRIPEAEPG